jgi:hypothetical protein
MFQKKLIIAIGLIIPQSAICQISDKLDSSSKTVNTILSNSILPDKKQDLTQPLADSINSIPDSLRNDFSADFINLRKKLKEIKTIRRVSSPDDVTRD